jgi:hypothetical protein
MANPRSDALLAVVGAPMLGPGAFALVSATATVAQRSPEKWPAPAAKLAQPTGAIAAEAETTPVLQCGRARGQRRSDGRQARSAVAQRVSSNGGQGNRRLLLQL